MVKENQKIKVKWHPSNKQYYQSRGYKFTKWKDEFEINIKDISNKSKAIIQVKCDYCNNIFEKQYQSYIIQKEKSTIKKDCCKDCVSLKNKEVFNEKYNANGPYGIKEVREKIEQTNIEKYNTKYPMQNKDIKERSLKNRYGDDRK